MTELEEEERGWDAFFDERERGWQEAALPMADFDREDDMEGELMTALEPAARAEVPCRIVMEDGEPCGKPAPRYGPTAGRCDDHKEEPLPENGPTAKKKRKPRPQKPKPKLEDVEGTSKTTVLNVEAYKLMRRLVEMEAGEDDHELRALQLDAARLLLR